MFTESVTAKQSGKHVTIPIFLPGAACPFQCIFCDQKKITGTQCLPDPAQITEIITQHLTTVDPGKTETEVGFFGGTFTGLPQEIQQPCLAAVDPFIRQGKITGIRLSTRPDFITPESLEFLKQFHVRTIELGVQSMDDDVLSQSHRGHTANDSIVASQLILSAGFRLGLQMMVGLPGDSLEKSLHTAREIIRLKALEVRIYPVVVIRGTNLEVIYHQDKFRPLSLETAVAWTKEAVKLFNEAGTRILRIGLHPSEGLLSKTDLVDGPFHPSFRELVMSDLWLDKFRGLLQNPDRNNLVINVHPSDLNVATGYYARNRKQLEQKYKTVKFISDPGIQEGRFHADHC